MKKLFFTLALVAFLFNAKAQTGLEIGLHYQPQVTTIINQQDMDAGDEYDPRYRFASKFGFDAAYNFTPNFGVKTGFGISNQGTKAVGKDNIGEFEMSKSLRYYKIPLLLQYISNPETSVAFLGQFGVQFSTLSNVNATAKYTSGSNISFTNSDIETLLGIKTKDAYAKGTTDLVLGLGTRVSIMENIKLHLSFRADYSLGDIEKNRNINEYANYHNFTNDANSNRKKSNNLTAGLEIGILYHFGSN